MDTKDLLKIVGAGLTGGYLAMKLRRPRKTYNEFLACYWAISIDVLRDMEMAFLEMMLPRLAPSDSGEFNRLLDENAEFLDKLKFFQSHLEGFEELALKAIDRFYAEKSGGNLALISHRKIPGLDFKTVSVAVQEAFYDLESAFAHAMLANAPEDGREELREMIRSQQSLSTILHHYTETYPRFTSVLFDSLAAFENMVRQGREQS